MASVIALGLAATSIAVGVTQSVESYNEAAQAAQNAEDNARMQQAQMEYNKRLEEREAAAIEAEGQENARRLREAAEQERSRRIAMLGKSGAAMTSGSPLAILGAAAADEEMRIQDSHYQNARQAAQHYGKAVDYGYGAAIARQNAAAARASRPSGLSLAMGITGAVAGTAANAGSYRKAGTAIYNAGSSAYKSIVK